MLFKDLSIDPRCLKLLKKQGIETPTPIQEESIPQALEGRDVIAIAQTGTGKTLAFSLPSLSRLGETKTGRNRMLVITPTRELALQVQSVIEPFATTFGLRSACLYGGVGYDKQVQALKRGCAIIVATPGRLLDHLQQKNLTLEHLEIFVLDEADRMLDMGFLPDVRRILSKAPKDRQTLMFSATFPSQIARLATDMQRDPVRVEVGPISTPVETVRQGLYTVDPSAKLSLLTKILNETNFQSALVFLRTKHRTDRVAKTLHKQGFQAQAIHGDRSQNQRQRALDGFRSGQYNVLVATDIAARGLDVKGISHVINFDIPNNPDEYIHRIGRTARANTEGDAITFVSPGEHMELRNIEAALGKNIPRVEWEGAVPVLSLFKTEAERANDVVKSGPQRHRRRLLQRR
jgi:ATP-dependent RNA helicase RhlE